MNYLAHFHLAAGDHFPDDTGLIIGALLGDYVKGPLRGDYPEHWETGIRLHRRIDALTDSHPRVQSLLPLFPGSYRRFAPIMLDVCFDHCLSQHWSRFHPRPLEAFVLDIYGQLHSVEAQLPERAREQAQRLRVYNVLSAMQQWRTVESMLSRIGTRLRRDNPLDHCSPLLQSLLPEIESAFLALYPELLTQLGEEFRG